MAVRSNGPDTGFWYVYTATLTLEIWPWVKVMTHPWVMDNNFVKYYQDPTSWWRVMARTQIFGMCALRPLTLEVWPWVKVMTHPFVMDNNCVKYYPDPTWQWEVLARTLVFVCVHCDLDLGDMTLGQGHDTLLSHGQQFCKILSRSNFVVKSYGPDTDFWYVCTATLTLEVWPWVKVMTHPFVMDNNCVKYYPDPTCRSEVMARTRIFGMFALWPWPWRYDLGLRSWHILGSWTTIVWNIQIQHGSI